MTPEEVPEELMAVAMKAVYEQLKADTPRNSYLWLETARHAVAAVLSIHEQELREQIVKETAAATLFGREVEVVGRSGRTYREWVDAGPRETLTGRCLLTHTDLVHEFVDGSGNVQVAKIRNRCTGTWPTFYPPLRIRLDNLVEQLADWQRAFRDEWEREHANDQRRQAPLPPSISRLFLDSDLIRDDRRKS